METDQIEDTLSYADLSELIKNEMAVPSQLLEHVAGRIARRIEECYPAVVGIELELTKENPPMGVNCQGAGVRLCLHR